MASKSVQTLVSKSVTSVAPVGRAKPIVASVVRFHLRDGSGIRPTGGQLFAYTAAWMSVSGMHEGKSLPRAVITRIAGARVVPWHVEKGNLEIGGPSDNNQGPMVSLTPKGFGHFITRTTDAVALEAYASMMATGKPNKYCRADHIQAITV